MVKKHYLANFCISMCLTVFAVGAHAQQSTKYPKITTPAKQALVIDLSSRTVLVAKSSRTRMYPASMTKVMTAYIVYEHLQTGFIDYDTEFTISYKARQMGGSRMFLEHGTQVTVKDLLYGLVVQSGNDAAVALAEGIGGSEKNFVDLMNAKAEELNMGDTNFVNASGWPDKKHYTTAWDLAVLAKRIIEDFPDYYPIYSEREFTYNGIRQENRNPLLFREIGVDGLKTGHTDASGYGLLASSVRDGRRMLLVINGLNSQGARSHESFRILQWAYNAWKNIEIFSEGTLVSEIPVILGKQKHLTLIASENVNITIPAKSAPKLTGYIEYKAPLAAPIKEGDIIGVLVLEENDKEIIRSPVIAAESIAQTGFLGKLFHNIGNIF